MRLLLDTHVWIWALQQPANLASDAVSRISAAEEVYLSSASVWELGIKHALGRISIFGGLRHLLSEARDQLAARELRISYEHALRAAELELFHKDPFDRLLVAQAQQEDLLLVTADDALRAYGIPLLWARPT